MPVIILINKQLVMIYTYNGFYIYVNSYKKKNRNFEAQEPITTKSTAQLNLTFKAQDELQIIKDPVIQLFTQEQIVNILPKRQILSKSVHNQNKFKDMAKIEINQVKIQLIYTETKSFKNPIVI
ncbi:hypothetical protein ABPG72_002922 [Tetrahymena utriculariae]